MLSKEYISDSLPYILTSDSGQKALEIMEDLWLTELPVVEEDKFLGLLKSNDIYDENLFEKKIKQITHKLYPISITENTHIFEAIKIMNLYNLSLLPVTKNDNYIGAITNSQIIQKLSKTITISEQGYYIRFELEKKDFSLTQIANIIENNNGYVLGFFIDKFDEEGTILVYFKIATQEIDDITQALDKYNFNYKVINQNSEQINEVYNDRLENLLKFINI